MYVWLTEEGNQTVLLFVLASCLGLASILFFFAGNTSSPTRFQFVLIVSALAVVFYMSLRSTTY